MTAAKPVFPLVRLPVDALIAFGATRARRQVCPTSGGSACPGCSTGEHYWHGALAYDLGVDSSLPQHWRNRGGLSIEVAERSAAKLGATPWDVWPAEWWDLVEQTVTQLDDDVDLFEMDRAS